jgi:hypothetical protein
MDMAVQLTSSSCERQLQQGRDSASTSPVTFCEAYEKNKFTLFHVNIKFVTSQFYMFFSAL